MLNIFDSFQCNGTSACCFTWPTAQFNLKKVVTQPTTNNSQGGCYYVAYVLFVQTYVVLVLAYMHRIAQPLVV